MVFQGGDPNMIHFATSLIKGLRKEKEPVESLVKHPTVYFALGSANIKRWRKAPVLFGFSDLS